MVIYCHSFTTHNMLRKVARRKTCFVCERDAGKLTATSKSVKSVFMPSIRTESFKTLKNKAERMTKTVNQAPSRMRKLFQTRLSLLMQIRHPLSLYMVI